MRTGHRGEAAAAAGVRLERLAHDNARAAGSARGHPRVPSAATDHRRSSGVRRSRRRHVSPRRAPGGRGRTSTASPVSSCAWMAAIRHRPHSVGQHRFRLALLRSTRAGCSARRLSAEARPAGSGRSRTSPPPSRAPICGATRTAGRRRRRVSTAGSPCADFTPLAVLRVRPDIGPSLHQMLAQTAHREPDGGRPRSGPRSRWRPARAPSRRGLPQAP